MTRQSGFESGFDRMVLRSNPLLELQKQRGFPCKVGLMGLMGFFFKLTREGR